jgi:predicted transcriptional regulator of viral defense system
MSQLLEYPKAEHSPTLETVLMVEETIRKAKQVISIAELKRRLPRQVNHNTLKLILAYLQKSGKIEFTLAGVVWIFMPKEDIAAILRKGRTWT